MPWMRRSITFLVAVFAIACATAPVPRPPASVPAPVPQTPPPSPSPAPPVRATVDRAPVPPASSKLPPVPEVDGPLDIQVVYPRREALVASRDSNFIFGSVGNGSAGLTINGDLVPVWPNGAFMGWLPVPPVSAQWYDIVAYTATDTTRLRYPVRTLAALPPRKPSEGPRVTRVRPAVHAVLWNDSLIRTVSDTDAVIIGRPTPTGTYHWFLFPGTPVTITEYRDNMARVRLDGDQSIWVSRDDIKRDRDQRSRRVPLAVKHPRIVTSSESVDLKVDVATPPAYLVDETDSTLTLTLYNSTSSADSISRVPDPLLDDASQKTSRSRVVYRFALTQPVYGYLALYEHGVFTFRIRRPPVPNATEPLRGMTIVVDPGHPPIGATGPTGLWEPVATLAVGFRVRDMLEKKGAHVVMTRTSSDPVALGDRPIMARRANANVLVSIHLNANADGDNPFRSNGTGTYYFHRHSKPLATVMQQALVAQLGLRDRGVFFQNLALCRPTWFPSVLAEGLFIIMPAQEAAIRTPEYQDAYARGIVDGLERYFTTFAR